MSVRDVEARCGLVLVVSVVGCVCLVVLGMLVNYVHVDFVGKRFSASPCVL